MLSNPKIMSPQAQRRRRGFKVIGGVASVLLVGWVVYVSIHIVSPSQGQLASGSNAVVSLAPQSHRLPLAEQLVEDGSADTLVISYFPGDVAIKGTGVAASRVPVSDYCEPAGQDGTRCFTPKKESTIGEAYAIREMAQAESWNSLTVVTDKYHAFRTRFIFQQCLGDDIDVNVVFAARDLNAAQWGWHVAYENVAFLKAIFQTTVRC